MAENTPLGPSEGEHHTLDHVDQYLRIGQESDASDIHLGVNAMPIWRRYGTIESVWLQADKLTAADTQRLAYGFLTEEQRATLESRGDVDKIFAEFGSANDRRLRASAFALATVLVWVAEAIDRSVALKLALEMVNGMAKTAPMTPEALARDHLKKNPA